MALPLLRGRTMRVVPRPITCLHVNRLQYGAIPVGRGKPSDCLVNAVPVNVKYYFTSSVFRHDLPGITDRICMDNFTKNLLQRRVLRFRSDENRNFRVGVFPKREEILIGLLASGGVALHDVGSADLEMGECAKELSLPKILSGANAFEISDIERMNIGAHQPGV